MNPQQTQPAARRATEPAPRPERTGAPTTELEYAQEPRYNPERKSRWWVWLIVLAVLGGAGYWLYPRIAQRFRGADKAGPPPKREVPVVAATARKGDLNLYINGLGTVTPFKTVTVRSRVDGEIMKVAFQEGTLVKEGDPLLEIDPRPFQVQLAQAEGQFARDAAQLKNAKLDLERYLAAGAAVAQQQIDTQKATIEQFEGVLKSDQSQIDNAKLQLIYCHVTAPITGRIGLRLVDVGNMVHANDQTSNGLAVITQLQPIAVLFPIPQDSIPRVVSQPNGGTGLAVEAWDRGITRKLADGAVIAIDNQVDKTTGTIQIKASFENKQSTLFPNQFVNARMLVETVKDAVLLPSAGVQRGPDSMFAYVVKPQDNTVEVRKIELGPEEGDQTVIASGIAPGEIVVTDGVDKLQPGAKVNVRKAGAKGASTRPTSAAARDAK